jgi:sulfite exporter TauE/SafE
MTSAASVRLFLIAAYNLGRIASYAIAGPAGRRERQGIEPAPPAQVRWIVKLVTGGFMIALGLYLAGWWPGLTALERLGGKLWVRIEPLGRRFLPVNHPLKALALGLVWGWLPCGLVYSALAWSLASGDAVQGAALMLAFGLGTFLCSRHGRRRAGWPGALSGCGRRGRLILPSAYTLSRPAPRAGGEHANHVQPANHAL